MAPAGRAGRNLYKAVGLMPPRCRLAPVGVLQGDSGYCLHSLNFKMLRCKRGDGVFCLRVLMVGAIILGCVRLCGAYIFEGYIKFALPSAPILKELVCRLSGEVWKPRALER